MLSEPRTQMRGRSELLAAIFCDVAVQLGGRLGAVQGGVSCPCSVVTWPASTCRLWPVYVGSRLRVSLVLGREVAMSIVVVPGVTNN